MFQKIKNSLNQLMVAALLLTPVLAVAAVPAVSAQDKPNIENNLCSGAANLQFGGNDNCKTSGGQAERKVNDLIADIINVFSVIVGIVAVIMIIYGGFRYIVSGGDSGNVTTAKNTILYAIIGLLIVAFAQFVVKFILGRAVNGGS